MRCPLSIAALALLSSSLVASCATRQPLPAPAPSSPDSESPLVGARKLLCGRIYMTTLSRAVRASLALDDLGPEGGGAEIFVSNTFVRVSGDILGESIREHFEYLYEDDDLVCAWTMTTSIMTILEQSAENPEGRPAFWRADFHVFDQGRVLHHTFDSAPGDDEYAGDAAAVSARAADIRRRVEAELR